jgi:hypothetical protein
LSKNLFDGNSQKTIQSKSTIKHKWKIFKEIIGCLEYQKNGAKELIFAKPTI